MLSSIYFGPNADLGAASMGCGMMPMGIGCGVCSTPAAMTPGVLKEDTFENKAKTDNENRKLKETTLGVVGGVTALTLICNAKKICGKIAKALSKKA